MFISLRLVFLFVFLFVYSESVPSGESQSVAGGDEDALDDYQELSTREEQDIESMMEMCEYAISNAEAFAEKLFKELQVLDGVSNTTNYFRAIFIIFVNIHLLSLLGQHSVHHGVREAGEYPDAAAR